jgi:hypothetical protein
VQKKVLMQGVLTRTLEYKRPGIEKPRKITVSVSAPEPDPLPRGDYRVLLTIKGFGKTYKRYHYGVDPLQAFLLALRIVPEDIRCLAEPDSRVTWLGSDDLGFRTYDY